MAELETTIPVSEDPMFEGLPPVPAGAVRAFGLVWNDEMPAYVEWQDGKVTDGTLDGQAAITSAVAVELDVSMPGVFAGTASVATKQQFMATAYSVLNEPEFSEEATTTGDRDSLPS